MIILCYSMQITKIYNKQVQPKNIMYFLVGHINIKKGDCKNLQNRFRILF